MANLSSWKASFIDPEMWQSNGASSRLCGGERGMWRNLSYSCLIASTLAVAECGQKSPPLDDKVLLTSSSSSSSSSSSCSWRVRHVILFLNPQDEVCPSISSSDVLCFFVLLVYIVVLVLVVCLCPSSVQWYLGERVTLLTNFSANDFFRCFSDSANEYGFG